MSLVFAATEPTATTSKAAPPAPPTPPRTTSQTAAPAKTATPLPQTRRHAILFFTASWCPSCVRMKSETLPYVSLPGHELRIIDVDRSPQTSQAYGIQSIPAYVVLDGLGRSYKQGVGFRDVRQFVDFLNGR